MCGLVGILDRRSQPLAAEARSLLSVMIGEIAYRGPDEQRLHVDGAYGIGFQRLAIVDRERGSQPFVSEDGAIIVAINGEIYNHHELRGGLKERHVFRSASDCEVVLHLYEEVGAGVFQLISGMFAAAIWDRRTRRLTLGRDRFGIKPLFYAVTPEALLFASEIKALLRHPSCPAEFDWREALRDPLLSSLVANPGPPVSYFRGIHQLPAATFMEADSNGVVSAPRAYWKLPTAADAAAARDDSKPEAIVEEYRAILVDSVRRCLMGEAERGAFLSGGIDSSGICAIAARETALQTFTVLGQSTFGNGDAEHAHRLARELGLPNHQVLFDWHQLQMSPEEWKSLLWLCETPTCGAEQLYKYQLYRFAKSVRPQLKVMLLGQGSDEFNGGYSAVLAPAEQPDWEGFRRLLDLVERDGLYRAVDPQLRFWDDRLDTPVLSREFLNECAGSHARDSLEAYAATKWRDLQMYNCWHEDRTAAGNSVENRVPFLDHRLVDLSLSLPDTLRPALLWDKQILRAALAPYLSDKLCSRPKIGFFHGKDLRYTNRMILGLLLAEGGALFEEAFGRRSSVLNGEAIRGALDTVREDPAAAGIETLLRLANMSLLERMASARQCRQLPTPAAPPEVIIEDWDGERDALALRLAVLRPQVELSSVLEFAPNAYLVRRDASSAADESYVVVDERVTYVVRAESAGPWLEVLRRVDGRLPLGQILQQVGATEADIRAHLEEAMSFHVLAVAQ